MFRPSRLRESSPLDVATVSLFSTEEGAAVCGLTSKVHIPFSFWVGDRTLQAGLYRVGPGNIPGTVILSRSGCDSQGILVQSIEVPIDDGSPSAKLLFYRQKDCYFLAQMLGSAATQ